MAPVAAVTAAAAVASSSRLLSRSPNPNPSSSLRPPQLLRLHPLRTRRSSPPPSLAISCVAVPSFIPPAVLQIARPLPGVLLASVRSLPARISAAAARAAPTPEMIAAIRAIFYAALANGATGDYFKMPPFQALVAGLASWIGLYAEILSIRCMLAWFPNLPWERQPFSALRDLCDPFLVLCRIICPPIRGFDWSPLLAFQVLGVLTRLLSSNSPPMS